MDRVGVIRDKNIEALIDQSDADVQVFDVPGVIRVKSMREKLEGWFSDQDGPIGQNI